MQKNNFVSSDHPKKHPILSRNKSILSASTFADEFTVGKVLGKGRFGNVCLAKHNQTNSIYAVKKIGL